MTVLTPASCLYDDDGLSGGSRGRDRLGYSYMGNNSKGMGYSYACNRKRRATFSLDPELLKNPKGFVFTYAILVKDRGEYSKIF